MIGLMDCNNFFVSCERLFRPDLRNKPVAVLSSNDGCIVARSQEIKDLGIPMGIPYFQVKEVCEKAGATIFSSNFTLYRDISSRIMQTLAQEVGECEIYSIDEAFFEVSDSVTEAAMHTIRDRIFKEIGMPVSIGLSATKTLAKEASEIAKKSNGVCLLSLPLWEQVQQQTSCSSVWGLGRKTSAKLKEMGVETVSDFLALDHSVIKQHFGVAGERIVSELNGIVTNGLFTNSEDVRQSIMSTRSFEKTTNKLTEVESAVAYHVNEVAAKLREKGLLATRMYVFMEASRHGDFFLRRGSAEVILSEPTSQTRVLLQAALAKTRNLFDQEVPYKKAGVVLSGIVPESYASGSLFEIKDAHSSLTLDTVTDHINERFGHNTIHSGSILQSGSRGSAKLRSKEYTTSWEDIPSVSTK